MACPFHKETGMEEGEQLVMVLIPAAVVAAMEQRIKFLERRLIGLAKEYTPVSPEAVSQSEEEAEALLGRFVWSGVKASASSGHCPRNPREARS
jgi:hypothetical protein